MLLQLRVSWLPFLLGVSLLICGGTLTVILPSRSFAWYAGLILANVSVPILLLAVPPGSTRVVIGGSVFGFVCASILAASSVYAGLAVVDGAVRARSCMSVSLVFLRALQYFVQAAINAWIGLSWLRGAVQRALGGRLASCGIGALSIRQVHASAWDKTRALYLLSTLNLVALLLGFEGLLSFHTDPEFVPILTLLVADALIALLTAITRVRVRVMECLAAGGVGLHAAAGVASLLGAAEPGEAIADARSFLRAISLDSLELQGLEPEQTLEQKRFWYERSQPAVFDSIDALVSHS
jgi:hypothetical protein